MKVLIHKAIKVIAVILVTIAIINIVFLLLGCFLKQGDNILNAIIVTIIMQIVAIALSIVIFKIPFKLIIRIMLLAITCSLLIATRYIPINIDRTSYNEIQDGYYYINVTGTESTYKNLYDQILKRERTYYNPRTKENVTKPNITVKGIWNWD